MVYYIHDVYECPCHFHMIMFEGDKLSSPFHIRPPFHNNIQLSIKGEYFVLKSNIFWNVPHNTTMCKLPSFLNIWQGTWWHLDVCMGKLMLLVCFPLIICFGCLSRQLNGAWDVIKPLNAHLMHHTITTLIIHTQWREHIHCAWNP
jgi:hypothetical protein